ncbi:hypothetical protein BM523_11795 [Alteromonas mediterranea]|uniref:hypothetical protein n=1 Tax=Alteromonas mediterranea TaxID=314275 RepID=UPI0009040078|nr:hypothetical protein [Alteromonas mediterranea]APD94639.1 hypothetical protein BM523_11795 [Alteromonas mediterranea]APD98275.1 hypothetical protein BM525_11860 [Alteromonas mediterranea]
MTKPTSINIAEVMDNPEKIEWILNKITFLESELAKLKKPQNQWLTLEEAAAELGKTVSAVRQRVKNKDKPMPEGKVWKQAGIGHAISVNVANFRKYM